MKKGFRHQTHPEDFLRLNGLISNLPKTLNRLTPDPWERIHSRFKYWQHFQPDGGLLTIFTSLLLICFCCLLHCYYCWLTRSILHELQELLPELAGRDHFELHVTVNSRLACTVLRLATYFPSPHNRRGLTRKSQCLPGPSVIEWLPGKR